MLALQTSFQGQQGQVNQGQVNQGQVNQGHAPQEQAVRGQAVQGQTNQHQPAQQAHMSMQALKDPLPAGGFSGLGGTPIAVTVGSRPQQQPRGPYNKQVINHGKSLVLMASSLGGACAIPVVRSCKGCVRLRNALKCISVAIVAVMVRRIAQF